MQVLQSKNHTFICLRKGQLAGTNRVMTGRKDEAKLP
jgi:hypothetical protein